MNIRTNRNLSSHIAMHTHISSTLYNPVTLTFNLKVNAVRGPTTESMCMVLIAQVIFLSECRQIRVNTQTDSHGCHR